MTTTVTRRDLFKFGGLAALGVAGASTLAGCGQPKTVAEAAAEKGLADTGASAGPAFLAPQEPITDFAETHEYDVVVVGAGLERALPACRTSTPPRPPATWPPPSTSPRPTRPPSRPA